jgi:glycolate oxidase FAD binding subunit
LHVAALSMTTANLPLTKTLAPPDPAAVAEAVRAAFQDGTAIYPIGGGTCRSERSEESSTKPDETLRCAENDSRTGMGLSTAALNRILDYPADDMTITVEAGVTIEALNRRLAEHHQWLPVDIGWPDRATVGGAIAVNAAGSRRYAYGTLRDYLLGFTAVDGTGTVFSGGARVVKSAAGYNMGRLMAGSRGTLGIVTQATLMVRPRSEAASLLACDIHDFALAEKLLAALVGSVVRPVAVELSAGRSIEGNPLFGPLGEGNVARLCIGFEGTAAEVDWMLNQLREEWTALGITSPVLMPRLADGRFWRWLAEFPADATLHVLPSKLIETIATLLKESPNCTIQAHAGDGVICVGAGIPPLAVSQPPETLPPELRIIRAIKERFDPKNILNPGQLAY